MAEQTSPVILDGDKVEKEIEALPKDEEGIPRLSIPVSAVPEAVKDTSVLEVTADKTSEEPLKEQLKKPEGVAKLASSLAGDVGIKTRLRTVPLREEAAKDIEKQVTKTTLDDKLAEAKEKGKTQVAGQEYDLDELEFMLEDEKSKQDLQAEMDFMENEVTDPSAVRPFERFGKFYTADDSEDASITDVKRKTQKYLKDIDDTLKPVIPESDLRNIVVKNMGRGVIDVAGEKLAETARGTVTGLPYLFGINGVARHGIGAFYDSFDRGTSFFDEFATRGPAMEGWFDRVDNFAESIKTPLGQPFQGPTIGRAANDAIRELLKKEVEEGRMSEERFDELNFVYDETQDKVIERDFLSDQDAQDLLNLAYNDLGFLGKIVVTGADVGAGYMSWSTRTAVAANRTVSQTKKMYEEYADVLDDKLAKVGKPPIERATNVFDMARTLEDNINTISINKKLLNLGIYQEKKAAHIERLETTAAEARALLKNVERTVDPGGFSRIGFTGSAPLAWRRAKAAKDNAEAALLRAKLGSVVNPILADGAKTWAITTLAQYTGREIMAGEGSDMDPQLAEFISASLAYSFGLPVTRVVADYAKSGTKELLRIPGSTRNPNWFANAADFLVFGKAGILADRTLTNYEKLVFEPKNGRLMNSDEKAGLRAIIRMYRDSSQDARDKFFDNAIAYQNMINDNMAYIRRVAPDKADIIERNLHTAFYHIGDMSRLAALGKEALTGLSLDDLGRNPTLDDLNSYMSDKSVALAEESIAVLKGIFATNNITGTKPDAIIDTLNSGIKRYKSQQAEDAVRLQGLLKEAVKLYGKSPADNIGPNLLENISEINKMLAKTVGETLDEGQSLLQSANDITDNLLIRSEALRSMDKGPDYNAAVARQLEDTIDIRDSLLVARSREIYEPVREYFKTARPIDMSDFVSEFLTEADAGGAIARFFSPQGAFFKGAEGRRIARSFEDMVDRVYGKETIKELKKALIDGGVSPVEVSSMSSLQIALRAEQAGGSKVFQAVNGEELDYMIRQMKSYAATTQNDKLAAVASGIETKLDDLLFAQDKEGYDILEAARKAYRTERGEAQRKGGLTDTIKAQREGPRRLSAADRDSSNYTIPLNGKDALQVIDDELSQHISNIMYLDTDAFAARASRNKIRNVMQSITTEFGIRGGPGGRSYFDINKEGGIGGRKQLAILQASVQSAIEATYGVGESQKLTQSLTRSERVGATSVEKATTEFDFSRLTSVLDVEDSTMVLVKDGDRFYEVPLVYLDEVYESAYQLEELYTKNKKIANLYDEGLSKFTVMADSEIASKQLASSELSRDAFSKLQAVFPEITDVDRVYQRMILSKGVDVTEILTEMAEAMKQANPKTSNDQLAKLADEFLKINIMEGLLNRADVRPAQGVVVPKLNKDTGAIEYVTPRVANSPEMPIMDITDNYEKFVSIFGEEHAKAIKGIMTMFHQMNQKTAALKGRKDPAVNTRNLLGKAYNIARDQVGIGYTIGDLAIRIMEDARVDLYRLIATNEDAALLTSQILGGMPVKKTDLERLGQHFMLYAITEIQMAGQDVRYYVNRAEQKLKGDDDEQEEQNP